MSAFREFAAIHKSGFNVSCGSGGDCDLVTNITALNGRYLDWLFETGE